MDTDKLLPSAGAILLDELGDLALSEVCRACAVRVEAIAELVDEGGLAPFGCEPGGWRLGGVYLRQATVALRLQCDLGVNPVGAALALQLLEELEVLQARMNKSGIVRWSTAETRKTPCP